MTDESRILLAEEYDEGPPKTDEVVQVLETLTAIAKSEGRPFLAYLLSMALMEARNEARPNTYLPH
jgi:hypothetical protein